MDVEIMVSAVEDMGLPDSSKRAGLCVTELAAADMQVTVAGGVPTDVVSMGPCDWVLDWAALVNDAHTPDHGESMTRTRQTTVRGGGGGPTASSLHLSIYHQPRLSDGGEHRVLCHHCAGLLLSAGGPLVWSVSYGWPEAAQASLTG